MILYENRRFLCTAHRQCARRLVRRLQNHGRKRSGFASRRVLTTSSPHTLDNCLFCHEACWRPTPRQVRVLLVAAGRTRAVRSRRFASGPASLCSPLRRQEVLSSGLICGCAWTATCRFWRPQAKPSRT
jgi:hypothetical protein